MITVDLTDRELRIILAALDTCNTVGGGSSVNTLLVKLRALTPDLDAYADLHALLVERLTRRVRVNSGD